MPYIIHISGAPGTGKTTLGKKTHDLFKGLVEDGKLVIKDTDEFIQHYTEGGKELIELEKSGATIEEYNKRWSQILLGEMSSFFDEHHEVQVIVLVGLLDNFGAEDAEFYLHTADLKWFLTIKDETLLEQYYTRVCRDALWEKMAKEEINVSSSREILRGKKKLEKAHDENGYLLIDRDKAITLLKDVILSRFQNTNQ